MKEVKPEGRPIITVIALLLDVYGIIVGVIGIGDGSFPHTFINADFEDLRDNYEIIKDSLKNK